VKYKKKLKNVLSLWKNSFYHSKQCGKICKRQNKNVLRMLINQQKWEKIENCVLCETNFISKIWNFLGNENQFRFKQHKVKSGRFQKFIFFISIGRHKSTHFLHQTFCYFSIPMKLEWGSTQTCSIKMLLQKLNILF
jgi:hypothetical protein